MQKFSEFSPEKYFGGDEYYRGHGRVGQYPMVCRAALHDRDDNIIECGNEICYGFLGEYREYQRYKQGMKGIFGSLWVKNPSIYKAACHYWDFLFSEVESPYRPLLKNHRIIRDNKDRPLCFYIALTDETSSQYLVNLLIATRLPYEHPAGLKAWDFFVKRGFSKHEAFLFLASVKLHSGDKHTYFQEAMDGQHMFVNWGKNIPLKKIVEAKPTLNNSKFTAGDGYFPCNAIWELREGGSVVMQALKRAQPYTGVFRKKFAGIEGRTHFENGIETNPDKVVELLMGVREQL